MNHSINQSNNQSFINQSVNESFNRSNNQSFINQSVNESFIQSINQSQSAPRLPIAKQWLIAVMESYALDRQTSNFVQTNSIRLRSLWLEANVNRIAAWHDSPGWVVWQAPCVTHRSPAGEGPARGARGLGARLVETRLGARALVFRQRLLLIVAYALYAEHGSQGHPLPTAHRTRLPWTLPPAETTNKRGVRLSNCSKYLDENENPRILGNKFPLTLSLPTAINFKFPLQPHQKYNTT